jgi:hypothetical protein
MTPSGGLRSVGYRGLPDLTAVMCAGMTGAPEVSQADVNDSDQATAQTISRMVDLIKESCADPLMQGVALNAWQTWGRGSNSARVAAEGVWWACKHMMTFVQDAPALARMFGPHDALELLVSPAAMIRCRQMEGDCDDFTMMACAMLGCLAIPFEILTVAASPQDPSRFSHVYARAVMPDGSRIPMDVSHGKYPGWEVPRARQFRVQVWDSEGNAISDDARSRWDGLHGYVDAPPMAAFRGFGHLRGLGCDCSESDADGDCIDPEPCTTDSGSGTTITTTPIVTSPVVTTTPVIASSGTCESTYQSDCPAGSTWIPATNPFTGGAAVNAAGQYVNSAGQPVSSGQAAVASIISSISSAFGAATTATVCNSQGVCTTGPANSSSLTAAASATGISSSWLLLGGLALGAILLVSAMSHK